jgi:hypothetical protein
MNINDTKKVNKGYWKGKKRPNLFSEKSKEKMSDSAKGKHHYWLGKKMSKEHRIKMGIAHKGEKNNHWKGGISTENHKLRTSIEFRLWREAVFARDNWTCQNCKIKGNELHPHHIKSFSKYPELRFAIDNGITLCSICHRKLHFKH